MVNLNVKVICLGLGVLLPACSSSNLQPSRDAGPRDAVPGDTGPGDTGTTTRVVDCSGACTFDATYTVDTDGFWSYSVDKAILAPSQAYQHLAYVRPDGSSTNVTVTCAPAIPACAGGGSVSACDIAQDLADPVVQAALAQSPPPFYGPNTLGTDGNAFRFLRDDGHGFYVGLDTSCAGATTCVPIPAAIARLKADLQALDSGLITSPECAALNAPLKTAGTGR